MSRRDDVLVKHREAIVAAAKRERALSFAFVGSTARGEDIPDSDLEFLVEFKKGITLCGIGRLEADLQDMRRMGWERRQGSTAVESRSARRETRPAHTLPRPAQTNPDRAPTGTIRYKAPNLPCSERVLGTGHARQPAQHLRQDSNLQPAR